VRTGGILGYWTFVVEDALYPPDTPELRSPGLRIFPRGQMTSMEEVIAGAKLPHAAVEEEPGEDRCALVIVDMQNDFISPERPAVVYGGSEPIPADKRERMLGNARDVAAAVRARGWPVVNVKVVRRADNLDDVHGKGAWVGEGLPPSVTHVAQGTWGAEIVSELQPEPDDFVVEKKGASGFGLTYLHRLLRNLHVRRFLLAGGSTTGCVRATMFDGIALGYDITVVSDATYPPDSPHVDFLAQWCAVKSSKEVLAELPPVLPRTASRATGG
jgi:nicotinamidase-related amidase